MSQWQDAHLRLLSTMPVRTHERRDPVQRSEPSAPPPRMAGQRGRGLSEERRKRVRAWLRVDSDERASERELSDYLGISLRMIKKLIRAVKTETAHG